MGVNNMAISYPWRGCIIFGIVILLISVNGVPISSSFGSLDYTIEGVSPPYKNCRNGETLYVGGSGPGNYSRIQDAIDNASDGYTIFVYNDSSPYYEQVVIDRSIKLIGEHRDTTIIDGDAEGDVVYIIADNVTIQRFTIQNSGDNDFDAGIEIRSDGNVIHENILCNNGGSDYNDQGGLYLNDSSYNDICNNLIFENDQAGVFLTYSHYNTICENEICNNNFIAIISDHSCNNVIMKNHMHENYCCFSLWPYSKYNEIIGNYIHDHPGCGIAFKIGSSYNTVRNNILKNNCDWGIMIGPGPVIKNAIEHNNITGCSGGVWEDGTGIVLSMAFFNTIRNNNLIDNNRNAVFRNSICNRWIGNYWDNYSGFGPHFIRGKFFLPWNPNRTIPWVNFDWRPAQEPHENRLLQIDIGPYTQNVTNNSITIVWETNIPSMNNTVVYGETSSCGYTTYGITNSCHHEITIHPPFTVGWYKVVSDGIESGDFEFHLTDHCYTTKKFIGVFYGDSRTNIPQATKVANAINVEHPDIVIHGGDMVANGNILQQWTVWLEFMRPLMQNTTVFGVLGNHENNGSRYYEIFALPNNEMWYSFDYGPCHFTILDNYEPWWEGSLQYEWLEEDLASTDRPIKIVCFHEPIYCSGGHSPRVDVREVWEPLFIAYDVDVVFQSHCHYYQRTDPIDGITYVVSGGGGAPLYDPEDAWFVNNSKKAYHYCMLDVSLNPLEITCSARYVNNTIFDEFVVYPPPAT
jgi:parallel beta-helix repeat protein